MATHEELIRALEARGITPLDLEDTVMALILDQHSAVLSVMSEEAKARLTTALAAESDALTAGGLPAQIAWMDRYYKNRDNLEWALAGYLAIPIAA